MRTHAVFLLFAALATPVAAGACSSSGSDTHPESGDASAGSGSGSGSSGSGGSSGGSSGGGSGSSSSGGGSGSGGSSGAAAVPSCVQTCTTPADCAVASDPRYTASHWNCQGGLCDYLGCQATSECVAALIMSNTACATESASAVPQCYQTCTTPTDCAIPSDPLYTVSHWTCQGGVCDYLGCQATSECVASLMMSNTACTTESASAVPHCYQTCTTPTDCAIPSDPLYTVSHWSCQGGVCDYLGCQSTSECVASLMMSNTACH